MFEHPSPRAYIMQDGLRRSHCSWSSECRMAVDDCPCDTPERQAMPILHYSCMYCHVLPTSKFCGVEIIDYTLFWMKPHRELAPNFVSTLDPFSIAYDHQSDFIHVLASHVEGLTVARFWPDITYETMLSHKTETASENSRHSIQLWSCTIPWPPNFLWQTKTNRKSKTFFSVLVELVMRFLCHESTMSVPRRIKDLIKD